MVAIFTQAGKEIKVARRAAVEAMFVIWDKAEFTAEGARDWAPNMVSALLHEQNVTGKLRKTEAELSEVVTALGKAATAVNFTSPKLPITYNAHQFFAMQQLVKDHKIHVVDLKAKPPKPDVQAAYVAFWNVFYFYPGPKDRVQVIVHEMTHAIQDWNDVKALGKYCEIDAYIVEGLVVRQLDGGRLQKDHPFYEAVEMVVAGKATPKNPAWVSNDPKKPGVYDNAAEYVVTAYGDPDLNKDRDLTEGEAGTDEKKMLDAIVKKLQAKP